MTTFVDTSVLIDILQPEAQHHQWSSDELRRAKENGPVVVSDMVYSEFSVAMASKDEVDEVIARLDLQRCGYEEDVLFSAGKAYAKYRARAGEGAKKNVLPDFFIGALANREASPLITRDPQKVLAYFPDVELITP